MDALISYISRIDSLSPFNAILITVLFLMARRRWVDIIEDRERMEKRQREHEMTFIRYGMDIERED